jgi:hypothetical protein
MCLNESPDLEKKILLDLLRVDHHYGFAVMRVFYQKIAHIICKIQADRELTPTELKLLTVHPLRKKVLKKIQVLDNTVAKKLAPVIRQSLQKSSLAKSTLKK